MKDRIQSPHYTGITDYFSGATSLEPSNLDQRSADSLADLIIVHFTNRSGSHFLCDKLTQATKRRNLNEALNWDTVVHHSKNRGYKAFSEYVLDFVCSEPSIIKVNTDQLFMLAKWGYLRAPLSKGSAEKPFLVTIRRNNVIAQAVSFSIALQTNQFTSLQQPGIDSSNILYKPDQIDGIIRSIGSYNQDFLVIAEALDYDVFTIIYEDLVKDPVECLSGLAKRIGAQQALLTTDSIYAKQSSRNNDIFRSRYIQSLAFGIRSEGGMPTEPIHP